MPVFYVSPYNNTKAKKPPAPRRPLDAVWRAFYNDPRVSDEERAKQ